MNLPISTIKALELACVHYTSYPLVEADGVAPCTTPPAEQRVILIMLADSIGKLQCLITQDRFLEITKLCESLGRNLKALPKSNTLTISSSFGLADSFGVPNITNYPTIIDEHLFATDTLYFESGKSQLLIKVDGKKNIQTLFQNMQRLDVTQPIASHTPKLPLVASAATSSTTHTATDEAKIIRAVESFTSLRIKQRLESTLEIPPLPDTGRKIIQLRVNPDAGVLELAAVVETDPSLAAQVVSWAGSPYYAAPGKVNSVQDAVMRVLGFDLVINLALGLSLGKTLEIPKDSPIGITPFWKKAVYCAAAAELIAKKIPTELAPEPGLAYLSGLLHNFGYLILGHVFPPHLSLINRLVEVNPHTPVAALEQFTIGICRNQIAAWLLNTWNMPEEVISAVRWQAHPEFSGELSAYPNIIFLASQIVDNHHHSKPMMHNIPQSVLDRFELSQVTIEEVTQKIWNNIEHLDAMAKNLAK